MAGTSSNAQGALETQDLGRCLGGSADLLPEEFL